MVGVSRETVGNWETGQTFPRNKAHRLRTEYGVDIHEIALRPKAAPVETPAPAGSDPLVYGIESAVASLRAGKDAQGVATFLETLLRGHQAHA